MQGWLKFAVVAYPFYLIATLHRVYLQGLKHMLFRFVRLIKKKLDVYFCSNILWLTSVFYKCILDLRSVYAWMQAKNLQK